MQEIENRRSIRKYKDQQIEKVLIEQIVKAAIQAPSAKNRQPWKFLILSQEKKEAFVNVMQYGITQEIHDKKHLPNSTHHINAAKCTLEIIKEAPVLILIVYNNGHSLYDELSFEQKVYERADIQSISAAVQNMLLEATHLGLGSLWICDFYFAYDEIKKWLEHEGELLAAVTLGYANEYPTKRPRKPLEQVIEYL